MNRARGGVIAALGFFSLVAQTLLFRDFLTALEGNELAIGAFFAAWLIWIALGAFAGRAALRRSAMPARRFPWLTLAYPPAFLIQHLLLINARVALGLTAYEMAPLGKLLAYSLAADAPVSFVTGFLFTLACRWRDRDDASPATHVYLLETLGGGLGGLAATLCLAFQTPAESVFLAATAVLVFAILLHRAARRLEMALAAALLIGLLLAALPLGRAWSEASGRRAWTRLLPVEAYEGRFTTAQASYLYGEHHSQFSVISGGGTVETLPNDEPAAESVALHLSQNPDATTVLIIGPGGAAFSHHFLALPQIDRVVWLHPDPAFPARMREVLPDAYRDLLRKAEIPGGEARAYLAGNRGAFDLAILNLPDADTLVLNRYTTREFFEAVRGSLRENGVVSVRISGGANYLGGELALLGASTLATIEQVFPHVVLKPGDNTLLFASEAPSLSDDAPQLSRRFASVPGAADVYPPVGLLSLYPADRIDYQTDLYRGLLDEVGASSLLNTADHPKGLLFNLLLLWRRAGLPSLAGVLPIVLQRGRWIALAAFLIYGLLRIIAARRRSNGGSKSAPRLFDGQAAVFMMGLTAMSLSIVLMFFYQTAHGSLFLHVGLVSALFMFGSFAGGLLSERLAAGRLGNRLLSFVAAIHIAALLSASALPIDLPRPLYAALFLLCGLFGGAYFPLAARRLAAAGWPAEATGARLEILDHLGGAGGGFLSGLIVLPLLGGRTALLWLAAGVAAVILTPALLPVRRGVASSDADAFDRLFRKAGWTMFGIGVFFLAALHLATAGHEENEARAFEQAAREMAGGDEPARVVATRPDGRSVAYFTLRDAAGKSTGAVFHTADFAEPVGGYGGPLTLAVRLDDRGVLRDFRVVRSRETPAYLEFLAPWFAGLADFDLTAADAFAEVDAVSGATLTSKAVTRSLDLAGKNFAAEILRLPVARQKPVTAGGSTRRDVLALAILTALAIALRFIRSTWVRRGFLALVLLTGGFWLNLQYSSDHIMLLLSLRWPALGWNAAFFLVVLIPAIVLLFGNVYCGYLCPFGALQELAGDLRPRRLATDPDLSVWRYGRVVKYALLVLLVVAYSLTADHAVLRADPLTTVFSRLREAWVLLLTVAIILVSFFYRRFWCRNLCPVGAFLSLLNLRNPLSRLFAKPRPSHCDMGLRRAGEADCLRCDRCRHEAE